MTNTNEFLVWQYDTPVINMVGDGEFDAWTVENAPSEDFDESYSSTGPGPGSGRRRVMIF